MSKRRPRCSMSQLFRKSMSELRALLPVDSDVPGEKRDRRRRASSRARRGRRRRRHESDLKDLVRDRRLSLWDESDLRDLVAALGPRAASSRRRQALMDDLDSLLSRTTPPCVENGRPRRRPLSNLGPRRRVAVANQNEVFAPLDQEP